MTIDLRPETEKLLQERLKTGTYNSPDDVVHAALEALTDIESLSLDDETLAAIDIAEDQIERGECKDWADVRESVRAMFRGK